MISRKTSLAIATAYLQKFSSSNTRTGERVYHDALYEFLYVREYEIWLCNLAQRIYTKGDLKRFFLQMHTGETLEPITSTWTWDQRRKLGQQTLQNLATDFVWFVNEPNAESHVASWYGSYANEISRGMELDGYLFQNGRFYAGESDILDVEAERGLLHKLYGDLGLKSQKENLGFLDLVEEHYQHSRWSDCIGNARKFFEGTLREIALRYSNLGHGGAFHSQQAERPNEVRTFLEKGGLLEKKEREAVDKIYGLLSHTGAHPYMAEKDQARLLRQLSLTTIQFVLLRLQGAISPK